MRKTEVWRRRQLYVESSIPLENLVRKNGVDHISFVLYDHGEPEQKHLQYQSFLSLYFSLFLCFFMSSSLDFVWLSLLSRSLSLSSLLSLSLFLCLYVSLFFFFSIHLTPFITWERNDCRIAHMAISPHTVVFPSRRSWNIRIAYFDKAKQIDQVSKLGLLVV